MLTWSNMSSIKQGWHLLLICSAWTSWSAVNRGLSWCVFLVLYWSTVHVLILQWRWCWHATSTSLLFTALQSLRWRAKRRQCTVIELLPVGGDRLLDRVTGCISATSHDVAWSTSWWNVWCCIVAWRGSNRSWLGSLDGGSISSLLRLSF